MKKLTLLELKDKRTNLLDGSEGLLELIKTEKRKLTPEEQVTFETNLIEIKVLDAQIDIASRIVPGGGRVVVGDVVPENRFSLIKAINNKLENRSQDDYALSIFTMGKDEMRKSGLIATGDIVLPTEFRTGPIVGGTTEQGAAIVAEEKKAILPPLVNKLILAQAGATFLTGLVGNVSIPSYSGTTVKWKGEVTAADDGVGAFSEVNLSPKRLTAYLDVSKLFLAQDSVGAEALLLDNIASAVARKLESTILGVEIGSADQPQGMGYKITTGADTKENSAVPTFALIVSLETGVDTANAAVGKLAYITNAGGRGILKSIEKNANAGAESLLEKNEMNGYPVLVTNGASAIAGDDDTGDLLVFGNWTDLCIGQFGSYDIVVDPYTVAINGQVRITINAYFDAKGLRGTAATDVHGVTVPDEYAVSFASMALKLS